MGVIIEELTKLEDLIKLVIDSQGIFWSFSEPNLAQESDLWAWNLDPKGL
jgi:hypothetical protein